MNWKNLDMSIEEDNHRIQAQLSPKNDETVTENERIRLFQLQKYQDPLKDSTRQALVSIVSNFGELLIGNMVKEIATNLLTQECEIFFFSSTGRTSVKFAQKQQGLIALYEDILIKERRVRHTIVDKEKAAVFQICNCKILYKEDNSLEDEITFEMFWIKGGKISKCIVMFAHVTPAHGPRDPLEPKKKDLILAKVKTLNYCLAGQPDLVRIASTLDENTEYKIWGWGSKKCVIINKNNFVESFQTLEETFTVKCIVPYEVYTEREFVIGTYVYHLEDKAERKYLWFSTCVYAFDNNLEFIKISQQGEFYPKSEAPSIPFGVYSREKLTQIMSQFVDNLQPSYDIFFQEGFDFDCEVYNFSIDNFPDTGYFEGLKGYTSSLMERMQKEIKFDWNKVVDVYYDCYSTGYDTIIVFGCSEGILNQEEYKNHGKYMNFLSVVKCDFENGKLVKVMAFANEIPEPIPSPFENQDFYAVNIIKKK